MNKLYYKLTGIVAALLLCLPGCQPADQPLQKYQYQFFDTFDTIIQVVGYAESQAEFDAYATQIHQRFVDLNNLFDRFHEYDGFNNLCTINRNAGIRPVVVGPEILDLLEFAMARCEESDGRVNIALGPVLDVWRDYMSLYQNNPTEAVLPSQEELGAAAAHTDVAKIRIDHEASTVYLEEPGMSIDVGAVAKGYAAQIVADEIYEQGFHSFLISAGGNVVAKDPPADGLREAWGVGIQNPNLGADEQTLDVAYLSNLSVVTSGDYQRFYMVGDQKVHHIIDANTLMPANYYHSLTIVHPNSAEADFLSTMLFVMDYDSCRNYVKNHNLMVMWVLADGSIEITDNLLPYLASQGASATK